MRGTSISALTLLLAACGVITESGTEEAVLFSRNDAAATKPQVVLKPYGDLPLSIEFSCPTKIFSAMTSVYIPLPPVVPVGFVNKRVSYVRIKVAPDAEHAIARIRIVTRPGQSIPLPDAAQSRRISHEGGDVELTYALQNDCEEFDQGVLEIAGFEYRNRSYPAAAARLHFDARIKTVVSYGLA